MDQALQFFRGGNSGRERAVECIGCGITYQSGRPSQRIGAIEIVQLLPKAKCVWIEFVVTKWREVTV